jgi:7-carboxy-7-deazaguanine synthase
MSKYELAVSEQFHSIQGEGPTAGVPSYFLRLKSCNILCGGKGTDKDGKLHDGATWRCDSIEVWLKGSHKSYDDIISDFGMNFINNIKFPYWDYKYHPRSAYHHLVITGGEPILQDQKLNDFLGYVMGTDVLCCYVEVETNGTMIPDLKFSKKVSQWNVSPKLSNSGVQRDKRVKEAALGYFAADERSIWKFVVSNYSDIIEAIETFITPFRIPENKCYFMPAADSQEKLIEVSQIIAQYCIEFGFRYSHRLQVAIWNKKTGV